MELVVRDLVICQMSLVKVPEDEVDGVAIISAVSAATLSDEPVALAHGGHLLLLTSDGCFDIRVSAAKAISLCLRF